MDNFLFYTVKSKGTLPYTSKFLCFSLFSCFYSVVPDEVLRIPNEELLVVIRGHNVLKLKKFDYADHPLAKELTPVSILDYTPPHAAAPFLQTETTLPRAVSEERPHTSSIPSKRRTLYSSAKPPSEF